MRQRQATLSEGFLTVETLLSVFDCVDAWRYRGVREERVGSVVHCLLAMARLQKLRCKRYSIQATLHSTLCTIV